MDHFLQRKRLNTHEGTCRDMAHRQAGDSRASARFAFGDDKSRVEAVAREKERCLENA